MGMIGRWIDEKCRTHPAVMRKVLGRKFGDLNVFFDDDRNCGCLVGSWEIESNTDSLGRPEVDEEIGNRVSAMTYQYASPPRHGQSWQREYPHIASGERKRPDAFVIRLVKQRIRKSLGLAPVRENRPDAASRETVVGVGASRPTGDPA
jgi:hypothetical protein